MESLTRGLWRALALIAVMLTGEAAVAARPATAAPATRPGFDLYLSAAEAIETDSPAMSTLDYPDHPPFGKAWTELAEASWARNGRTRALARVARAVETVDWSTANGKQYLRGTRRVAQVLTDAALYRHVRGDDAAAMELIRDALHLARLLRQEPAAPAGGARLLVGAGIERLTYQRLLVITSSASLAADAGRAGAVPVSNAKALVGDLLAPRPAAAEVLPAMFGPEDTSPEFRAQSIESAARTLNRAAAERLMVAVALSAHVFRFEKGRWPLALAEMVPADLPRAPLDPFGDGTQPIGYALIPAGLPDGSARPLVYTRDNSPDGLRYRTDGPQYSSYEDDGSTNPSSKQLKTGQFRDIAVWTPVNPPPANLTPRVKPLPATPRR